MKVGDRVIYMGGSSIDGLMVGREYKIDSVGTNATSIRVEGDREYRFVKYFKLKNNTTMNYPTAVIKKCEPEVKNDEVVIDECRMVEVECFEQVIAKDTGKWIIGESLIFKKKAVVLSPEFEYALGFHEEALYLFIQKKETN